MNFLLVQPSWRITFSIIQSLWVASVLLTAPTASADPLSEMDAVIEAATVLEACHLEFKSQVPDTVGENKAKALGNAAYQQILSGLANPTDDSTRHKADFLLKKRTEVAMSRARALVAEKGCGGDEVSQANGILEKFQQAL